LLADDTTLYIKVENPFDAADMLTTDVDKRDMAGICLYFPTSGSYENGIFFPEDMFFIEL